MGPVRSVALLRRLRPARVVWMLAPVLLVAFLTMHTPQSGNHAAMDHGATDHGVVETSAAQAHSAATPPADDDPGHPLVPAGCGPVMLMCLALLIAFAICSHIGSREVGGVLWRRPPPARAAAVAARRALESLTPLQRTTVLRC